MNLLRSSAVVGGLTMLSRVLGFAREMLFARVLGAGPVSDAFFIAFRLPNLFRRVLAEGAFSAAFVPLYSKRLEDPEREGDPDALASETYSVLFAALLGLVVLFQLFMPVIILALAPGYADQWEWVWGASLLGLLTMPYILFMSLTAMFGGVLNARGRFAAFAFAPSLLNVVLVGVLLAPIGEGWIAARWLALGVFVAGFAQLAVVAWGLRREGVRLRLRAPKLTPGVKRVVALGIPGAAAAGVTQINVLVGQMLASGVEGAVSWLAYADRLYQLPMGVIGVAMGVALLPALSRQMRADATAAATDTLNRALEISAVFTLPAAAALAAAPHFWVQALFQRGAFEPADTAATGPLVLAFAIGLPAFILVKVLSPGYFAREDTATPMRFAAVTVGANVALGIALFATVGVVGLAAATAAAGWLNAALLARGLGRDGLLRPDGRLLGRLPRVALATGAMTAAVWWMAREATPWLGRAVLLDVAIAVGVAGAGLAVFALSALAMGAVRPADLKGALRRA